MSLSSFFQRTNSLTLLTYGLFLFISYKATVYIYRAFFHPLSKFPGPPICSFSRLYEFYWDSIQPGRLWTRLPELHKKYGPIIRMGPDELHIQDPEYFMYLFAFKPLDKYALAARQFGLRSAMFGTEEYKQYTHRRAAYGDTFSKTKTFRLQPLVNEKIAKGCAQMREKAKNGEKMDLAYLMRAISAEIITEYMYGQQYGFFEDETTTKGLYDRRFDSIFGLTNLGRFIPFWIPMLLIMLRGKIRALLGSKESMASVLSFLGFAEKMLKQQLDEHGIQQEFSETKEYKTMASVYLHSSLPLEDKQGQALIQATMAPWSGGWDTTAFALTQGSYYLLRHPSVLQKLQLELQTAWPDPSVDPTMTSIGNLPYLSAVVNETLRLMLGALCRLTRINSNTPEQYKSYTIPANTRISMSIPDINLSAQIWGPDAHQFRPERWLEGQPGHFPDMEKWLMTFSRGARVCPGQELAWMEMKMILGTLFRRFEMELDGRVSDADVLPYTDGFTPGAKNMIQWVPVGVKERR